MIKTLFAPLAMKIAAGLQILSLGFIVFLLLAKAGETRRADKLQVALTEEATAHELTKAAVLQKTAEAKAADAEHARAIERTQAQVTQEVSHDYQTALADLRRRYDALRLQPGTTANGEGGGRSADLPGLPDASSGPYAAAPPGEDDFNCAANTLQLEALISWVRQQSEVERGD